MYTVKLTPKGERNFGENKHKLFQFMREENSNLYPINVEFVPFEEAHLNARATSTCMGFVYDYFMENLGKNSLAYINLCTNDKGRFSTFLYNDNYPPEDRFIDNLRPITNLELFCCMLSLILTSNIGVTVSRFLTTDIDKRVLNIAALNKTIKVVDLLYVVEYSDIDDFLTTHPSMSFYDLISFLPTRQFLFINKDAYGDYINSLTLNEVTELLYSFSEVFDFNNYKSFRTYFKQFIGTVYLLFVKSEEE